MKKEQQDLLDKVYGKYLEYTINGNETELDKFKGYLNKYLVENDVDSEHLTSPSFTYGYKTYSQEKFIYKCKTDPEFSEKWGLKIEKRELSLTEMIKLAKYENAEELIKTRKENIQQISERLSNDNIPTKLITLTYNDTTIESYE